MLGRLASRALCILALVAAAPALAVPPDDGCALLEMYSREGCPHCADARAYLDVLTQTRPDLRVVIYDVVQDADARDRLIALSQRHGLQGVGVPAFSICGEFSVGFQDAASTGRHLAALIDGTRSRAESSLALPWLGTLSVEDIGLPMFTVAVGLVDGFNPCAMWVLLFLLSILVNLQDRRRILLVAGTFVFVSGAVYFLFMAAWLNVFLWIGLSRALQLALAGVAIVIGGVHVKDFFAFGKGPSFSIPAAAKPGIYARVRRIVQAESLIGALAGAWVLAILVNFVELLCTAGLPALYTQILTLHEQSTTAYYGYLLLYNLAYVTDDAAMVALVVVTLGRHKLDEQRGRWLKLTSGAVMLALGVVLLARPGWLAGS